jgi:hypothetical protein
MLLSLPSSLLFIILSGYYFLTPNQNPSQARSNITKPFSSSHVVAYVHQPEHKPANTNQQVRAKLPHMPTILSPTIIKNLALHSLIHHHNNNTLTKPEHKPEHKPASEIKLPHAVSTTPPPRIKQKLLY